MHRYTLEPWQGPKTRYACPACHTARSFTRYIDTTTGQHVAPHVGRCSREVNCAYHYKPAQHFAANNICHPPVVYNKAVARIEREPSFIAFSAFIKSFSDQHPNNFLLFLTSHFGAPMAARLRDRYLIGTSGHWHGANIFWQVDKDGKVRTGKIMCYDEQTCRRIKQPYSHISWVHAVLQQPNYRLRQCLFGEHLLDLRPPTGTPGDKPIAIVESEKTAIIASAYLPAYTWMACGSLSNLNEELCGVLKGRQVVLFPDMNGYDKWSAKARQLFHITTFSVSDLLEQKATAQDRSSGLDLADYLLQFDWAEF